MRIAPTSISARRARALAFLLPALLAAAPAASAEAEAPPTTLADTGPLGIRDQFLLDMGYLAFQPDSADVLARGRWRIDAVETVTNTFAHSPAVLDVLLARTERRALTLDELRGIAASRPRQGIFQLDGEVYSTAVRLRRGFGDGLELELMIPVLDAQGGHLDGVIESFHSTFGLAQNGRLGVPRNGYLVYLKGAKGETFLSGDRGWGLGDLVVSAKHSLDLPRLPFELAVLGSLKLPTGDQAKLYDSGSVDLGLQLLATRHFARSSLHAGLGLLVLGDSAVFHTDRQLAWSTLLAYEHALGRSTAAIVQLAYSQSPFRQLDVADLDVGTYEISVGLKQGFGANRQVFLALTENLAHYNNTSDVGFHLGFTRGF
ncbi:MAG TPA: DUF3187 family protein [Thermoanaerobaculia bacterium]|nr:DUF3187 family protein [Thermoanaerobaculia bacterium]